MKYIKYILCTFKSDNLVSLIYGLSHVKLQRKEKNVNFDFYF